MSGFVERVLGQAVVVQTQKTEVASESGPNDQIELMDPEPSRSDGQLQLGLKAHLDDNDLSNIGLDMHGLWGDDHDVFNLTYGWEHYCNPRQ